MVLQKESVPGPRDTPPALGETVRPGPDGVRRGRRQGRGPPLVALRRGYPEGVGSEGRGRDVRPGR